MTEMFALTVGQSTVSVGQGRAVNVLCADAATPDAERPQREGGCRQDADPREEGGGAWRRDQQQVQQSGGDQGRDRGVDRHRGDL